MICLVGSTYRVLLMSEGCVFKMKEQKSKEQINSEIKEIEAKIISATEALYAKVREVTELLSQSIKLKVLRVMDCDSDCANCSSKVREAVHSSQKYSKEGEKLKTLEGIRDCSVSIALKDMIDAVQNFNGAVTISTSEIARQLLEENLNPEEFLQDLMMEMIRRRTEHCNEGIEEIHAIPF